MTIEGCFNTFELRIRVKVPADSRKNAQFAQVRFIRAIAVVPRFHTGLRRLGTFHHDSI